MTLDAKRSAIECYRGDGSTVGERQVDLPQGAPLTTSNDPAGYLAEPGLRAAVNVALRLGQPLLVTGEPGTGKTQLAASIAYELELPSPLVFHTKTTSSASDLFYRYDALGHFHSAQFDQNSVEIEHYLTLEALGLAFLLSWPAEKANPHLPEAFQGRGPVRSVVLVDEIDKAPRDLPNDVLNEFEKMSFTTRETGRTFTADPSYRPILIITSNSEKNLPDAFLRRCVFFHISFPNEDHLREIVQRRLPSSSFSPERLENALKHFSEIRSLALRKKPATAELLAWLQIIDELGIDPSQRQPGDAEALAFSYAILAKGREDLSMMTRRLEESPETR